MRVVVALGNYGINFKKTRHNIGFLAIDHYANKNNLEIKKKFLKSLVYKAKDFILVKPQTYMNNSGEAVAQILNFYKIEPSNLLVIYDDINLPLGKIRSRIKGSHGGQNGMKNIIQTLKTKDIFRVRIGIGKNEFAKLSDWVLSNFSNKELEILNSTFNNVDEIINLFLSGNFSKAINRFN